MVSLQLLMPTWLIVTKSWQRQHCDAGLYQVGAYSQPMQMQPTRSSQIHSFFLLRSRMVSAVKTHVCLWREREGGQGIELREVRRPRRSCSCQKMSQKSAKSTTGSGRSLLFRFGLLSGPFVRREGAVQKLVHHCHHLGKAIGHFVRFIGEPKRFGKCYLWPTFESQKNV